MALGVACRHDFHFLAFLRRALLCPFWRQWAFKQGLSMKVYQTKKTNVQTVAMIPTGHSIANPARHF